MRSARSRASVSTTDIATPWVEAGEMLGQAARHAAAARWRTERLFGDLADSEAATGQLAHGRVDVDGLEADALQAFAAAVGCGDFERDVGKLKTAERLAVGRLKPVRLAVEQDFIVGGGRLDIVRCETQDG